VVVESAVFTRECWGLARHDVRRDAPGLVAGVSLVLGNSAALAAFWDADLERFGTYMSSPSWDTAAYWREQAAGTPKLADHVEDASTRKMILRAAQEYDRLAEQAERRETRPSSE
jgi:hypothetical protein